MRWPWQRHKDPTLEERLEVLEDHYKRLERRFVKLQGEFSAYQRDYYDRAPYEDDDEEEDDDGQAIQRA